FQGEHRYSVTKDAHQSFGSNVNISVSGHRTETIGGNTNHLRTGSFYSVTCGAINDLCLGEKSSTVVGLNATINVLLNTSTNLGGTAAFISGMKLEYVQGGSICVTTGAKASVDQVAISKADFKLDNVRFQYRRPTLELHDGDVELLRKKSRIHSATMTIFK